MIIRGINYAKIAIRSLKFRKEMTKRGNEALELSGAGHNTQLTVLSELISIGIAVDSSALPSF